MALGAAIGVGLFLGSAKAIQMAGPAIMISYALGGFAIFLIMRALGEMAIHGRWPARSAAMPKTIWAAGRLSDRLELLVFVDCHLHGGNHRRGRVYGRVVSGRIVLGLGAVGTGDHGLGQFHCRQGLRGI